MFNLSDNENIEKNENIQSDIFSIIIKKDTQTLIQILEKGQNPNEQDKDGFTPLHYCAFLDDLDGASLLISKGAIVDFESGFLKQTPLHIAAFKGSSRVLQFLIKNEADPFKHDAQGYSAIHLAAQENHPLACHCLVSNGVSVDELDVESRTPSHWAAIKGNTRVLRYFVSNGANINLQDSDGCTPLHWGALLDHREIIGYLIQKLADLSIRDNYNSTPYDCALESGNEENADIKTIWCYSNENFLYVRPFHVLACDEHLFRVPAFPVESVSVSFSDPQFHRQFENISKLFSLILSISSFCLFYFYHISITRDPGILQTPSLEPEELVTKNSIYSKYDSVFLEDKFCETCRIFRPLRSKHDSTTNRCIARFDHFCPWTINGVGHNNHTYFYYFLVSVVVSCGIFTFIVLDTLVQNNKTESFSFSNLFLFFYNCYLNDSWLLAIWILNNLILGWVIALWLQHSWFIIQNITTNEMLNRRRYSHFLKNSRFHNPFSLGSAYRNSLQFFKINYLVDWYNVFWFDNLRFGDHQHLQVLNQKII
ncbi:palmitoyltransferase hip14 [Anaeramoeba ignava]|uniref:Palmitoyltransferase n=1 Tax=Anaeramoeba ignava TaxID=1746090 RepID=A0A9Q0LHN5_ANAIG|nr:palmitoyltransferase hip14 [Anaeramoeba ignava]